MRTLESVNKEANEINLIVAGVREFGFKVYHGTDLNNINADEYIYNSTDIEVIHGFIIGYATARQTCTKNLY